VRRSSIALVSVLGACSRAPAPAPAPTAAASSAAPPSSPIASHDATPVPPREHRAHDPVRSCPASGRAIDVALDPRIAIGWAGGVSWLFGYDADDAKLVHLDPGAKLAKTPVPLHNTQAAAVDGDRIWLYAPSEAGPTAPPRWTMIDVSRPDAPATGPVVPLSLGGPKLDWAAAFGVSSERALLVTGTDADRQLVLVDTKTRAAVVPPIAFESGFVPSRAWCHVDRCAVVGIANEGGGPKRRLVVARVSAAGVVEREEIAPDWIGRVHVALAGDEDAMIVAWQEHGGFHLRWLDLWGRPKGGVIDARWEPARYINHDALLEGPGGPTLAIGDRTRWSAVKLGPGTVGSFADLPGADRYFLAGAALDDGVAWATFTSNVDYSERSPGVMMHSWSGEAATGFAPSPASTATPSKRVEIVKAAGPGRGGFEAYVLARPGAASTLVVPRDDAARGQKTELTPLRSACPR
jgi:hypothetical protein